MLLGWPIALFPVHIAFLELIIDPVCSVVFEAEKEEKNIMKRKPRRKDERLFDNATLALSAFRGIVLLAVVAGIYHFALAGGTDEDSARAMAFTSLVLGNLALILSSRSQAGTVVETLGSENKALWVVMGVTLFFLALVLYVPFLQELFKLAPLSIGRLALCAMAAVAAMVVFEIAKVVKGMRGKQAVAAASS